MPFSFSQVEVNYLASGKRLSRTSNNLTSLSPDEFWSAFDDYLALQQALSDHPDLMLETGDNKPTNGIGSTIRFEYKGSLTRETLVVYDSQKRIWKINIPEANSFFSFYELTIRVYPMSDGSQGSEVTFTLDFALQEQEENERTKFLQIIATAPERRVEEFNNFILERDGLRCSFEVDVYCPAEQLWAIIGNWEDISWVQHAIDVRMIPVSGRRVFFPQNKILEENLIYASDAEKLLVYEVTKSVMPVSLYRGTITLSEINSQLTKVQYNNVFIPQKGQNPQQVKAEIEKSFQERFSWFQNEFDTSSLS